MDLTSVLDRTRQVARDVLAADAREVDAECRWPERGLRALQEAGLGGLIIPEEMGGHGRGLYALALVCEILGRECASTSLCYGMHCVGAATIAAKATSDQRPYVEAICEGTHLTTLALSEPGSGAHFYYPQTRLVANGQDGFHVSGTKSFVTNGGCADSYVVSTVAADPSAPPGQFSCVVIRGGAAGMAWGPQWAGLGMRGNSSRMVELKDVPVPRSDLLGEEGDQIWYMFHVVTPYFLVAMAATYLGVASTALDEARQHLARRHYSHSGSTLSQISVLQHRLGCLWAEVERTRRLIYFAASEFDTGAPDALVALCSAKAEVADCVVNVVNQAMSLTGGVSYREGARLDRLMRDARAAHVMAPTTDILRTWAGRALLDHPILGD